MTLALAVSDVCYLSCHINQLPQRELETVRPAPPRPADLGRGGAEQVCARLMNHESNLTRL